MSGLDYLVPESAQPPEDCAESALISGGCRYIACRRQKCEGIEQYAWMLGTIRGSLCDIYY